MQGKVKNNIKIILVVELNTCTKIISVDWLGGMNFILVYISIRVLPATPKGLFGGVNDYYKYSKGGGVGGLIRYWNNQQSVVVSSYMK